MFKRIVFLAPLLILFVLFLLLIYELFYSDQRNLSSPLIGKPVPHFQVQNVFSSQPLITDQQLKNRGPLLLNFWATWCYACKLEHEMLNKIARQVPIIGIVYKDDLKAVRDMLATKGNPFIATGDDSSGDVAMEFGVYGTPETYVINNEGKIIYRHIGMIDEAVWQDKLLPLLRENGLRS